MLQNALGNLFVGGLVLFTIIALVFPIVFEIKKRLQKLSVSYIKKLIVPSLFLALFAGAFWVLIH